MMTKQRRLSDACLSDLVLDELTLDEQPRAASVAAHLESCVACRQRLVELGALQAALAPPPPSDALAAALREVAAPAAAPRVARRRWRTPLLATSGMAAAAALLLLLPAKNGSIRLKGGFALGLVVRDSSGRTTTVLPGEQLKANNAIRFRLSSASDGYLVVLGLDAAQQVTPYAPAVGHATPLAATPELLLDGSIILDDSPGSERIVALRCERPIEVDAAVAAGKRALARAGGDPKLVGDLGLGCAQASAWFTKTPR